MDGKQNDTTGTTQQCSSASLPLTGRFSRSDLCLLPLFTACPENVMSDLRLLPLCAEELCLDLSRAIEAGDVQAASQHAAALARQSVSLTIQLSEKNYPDGEIKWDMKDLSLFLIVCPFSPTLFFHSSQWDSLTVLLTELKLSRRNGQNLSSCCSSTITVPRSALQGPPIHPFTHQWVSEGAAQLHWEQFKRKCLAQGHSDKLGGSGIWPANPSVIGQPTLPPEPQSEYSIFSHMQKLAVCWCFHMFVKGQNQDGKKISPFWHHSGITF